MSKCQSCRNQVTLSRMHILFIFLKGTKNPAEIESEEVKHMEIINIKRASQSVGDTVMTAISSGGD